MKKAIETKAIHTVTSIELSFGQLRPKKCLNNLHKITKTIGKIQKTDFLAIILVNRRPNFAPKVHKRLFSPQKWLKRPSQRAKPIMEEFLWHTLDCVLRPKTSIRSLPTSFRTLAEIMLRRKNANRDVQNTFKSPVLFLQKIEKSHFTKDL